MNNGIKIQSFMDLNAWKYGHELVLEVYKITSKFPKIEQFGLSNQLRRAAVSCTSIIAEGFSRNSYKEKLQFYSMALGSLTEIQNQLLIAKDIGYLQNDLFGKLADKSIITHKLLQGLIKKSKSIIHDS